MMKYAQIDTNGIVVGISALSGLVNAPNLIEIGSVEPIMGSVWDGSKFTAPPAPPIEYQPLSRIDFFRLLTAAGGLTQANLVAAKADTNLAAFWILLELTERVHRDAPEISPALTALEGLGYLDTGGAAASLAAWPAA